MSHPSISIQIVTYQSALDISRCLDSIAAQSIAVHEILILDNSSQDKTISIIENHILFKKNKIKIFPLHKNIGFAAAHTILSKRTSSEYIFILNPDAYLDEKCLGELVTKMKNDSSVFAAQPVVFLSQKKTQINLTGKLVHYLGFDWLKDYLATEIPEPGFIDSCSGSAVLIDRKKFLSLGGFDPFYFMYYEDSDLSWKARLAGYKLWFEPKSIVYHDYKFQPKTEQQSFHQKLFYIERNRVWTYLKNYELHTILLLLPAQIVTELSLCIYAALQGWMLIKLKSYQSIFVHREKLLLDRKKIEDIRRISDREITKKALSQITFSLFSHPAVKYILNPFLFLYWQLVKNLI